MAGSDFTDVEKLLLDYMRVDSTTEREGEFGEMLKVGLEQNGWIVVKQPLNGNSSRFNLLATRRPLEEFSPRVLFNSHLDTVPPFIPPTEDSQNIYGRGACDAKGQIACMVTAAQALVDKHPKTARELALLFVVDEEVNHTGMQKANEFTALQPEYLVVGEPTELKFATIQKGALKVVVRCKGKAGHSGYPSEGESAIHKLIPVLNDVLNYAWPKDDTYGATTVNIGIMEGGQAQNAWAENAYARIFVRVTTSVADAQKRLEEIVAGRANIEVISFNEPVVLSNPPLDYPTDQVAFNTDLPYYSRLSSLKGKYLFGAGTIKVAHSKHELVPKREIHACREALIALVLKLCS
ncbi:hypothetical protein RB195_014041 [Necator americanus]